MQLGAPPKSTTTLWQNEQAYATPLLLWFADRFGTEALEWSPMTIAMELRDALGEEALPLNFDKLMAAITIVTTDRFYGNLPDFIHICNVLSGTSFDPTQFDPADTLESCWGLLEAGLLDPPDEQKPLDETIENYLEAVLEWEGYTRAPRILRSIVQDRSAEAVGISADTDPQLAQQVYISGMERAEEIDSILKARMAELTHQVHGLQLEHGDPMNFLGRLNEDAS